MSKLSSTDRMRFYNDAAKRGNMLKPPKSKTTGQRVAYLARASAASQVAASIAREASNMADQFVAKADIEVGKRMGEMERLVVQLKEQMAQQAAELEQTRKRAEDQSMKLKSLEQANQMLAEERVKAHEHLEVAEKEQKAQQESTLTLTEMIVAREAELKIKYENMEKSNEELKFKVDVTQNLGKQFKEMEGVLEKKLEDMKNDLKEKEEEQRRKEEEKLKEEEKRKAQQTAEFKKLNLELLQLKPQLKKTEENVRIHPRLYTHAHALSPHTLSRAYTHGCTLMHRTCPRCVTRIRSYAHTRAPYALTLMHSRITHRR
jgi:hypothetical protein